MKGILIIRRDRFQTHATSVKAKTRRSEYLYCKRFEMNIQQFSCLSRITKWMKEKPEKNLLIWKLFL